MGRKDRRSGDEKWLGENEKGGEKYKRNERI